MEIVGVVGAVVDRDLATEAQPGFYVPITQAPYPEVSLVIRSDASPERAATLIRSTVADIDPLVPVSAIMPLERLVWGSMASPRWTATVLSLFAVVALALGCVGVYGVIAYSVRQRTREIGVRMALGAGPASVRRQVLHDAMMLALPGAAIGLLLALPATRTLSGMLFGVAPLDPMTFLSVPLVLVVAAVAAAYVPARRATRVDPVDAIRTDG